MAGFIEIFGSFGIYIENNLNLDAIIKKINDWVRDQKEFYWKLNIDGELVELIVSCLRDFYSMCTNLDQNIEISSGAAGYQVACSSYSEFGAIHVEATTKTIKTTGFRDYGKLVQSTINWK